MDSFYFNLQINRSNLFQLTCGAVALEISVLHLIALLWCVLTEDRSSNHVIRSIREGEIIMEVMDYQLTLKWLPLISACCIESKVSSFIHNRSLQWFYTIQYADITGDHFKSFWYGIICEWFDRCLSFQCCTKYSCFVNFVSWQPFRPSKSVCCLIYWHDAANLFSICQMINDKWME